MSKGGPRDGMGQRVWEGDAGADQGGLGPGPDPGRLSRWGPFCSCVFPLLFNFSARRGK